MITGKLSGLPFSTLGCLGSESRVLLAPLSEEAMMGFDFRNRIIVPVDEDGYNNALLLVIVSSWL